MKKIISIFAVIVMLLTTCIPLANASDAMRISVSSAEASPGDVVTLNVNVSSNPGFCYMKLKLEYDSSALTLLDMKNGTVSSDAFSPVIAQSLVSWDTLNDATANGLLMTVKFQVKSNVAVGDYSVRISNLGCYNYNEEDVVSNSNSGKISISNTSQISDIKLSEEKIMLAYRYTKKHKLTVEMIPNSFDAEDIVWSSDNTQIVNVDSEGNVTVVPKGYGTAHITASVMDGEYSATCEVTVSLVWWQWLLKVITFGAY